MLSEFAKGLFDPRYPWKPSEKLIPNLLDKTKYVAHYRNLQFYINHGLVLTKIHRVITFTQEPWLRPWIDLCTAQRQMAQSDFESDLAKLQANATFRQNDEKCSKSTKYSSDRRFAKSVESGFKSHVSTMRNNQRRPSAGQRRATKDHVEQTNSRRIYNFGTV